MYSENQGLERNYAKAAEWFLRAAEQGYTAAQFNLGLLYEEGEGVEQDHEEAIKWYRKAAEAGDIDAQSKLELINKTKKGK